MGNFMDPAMVPSFKLNTGDSIPAVGIGTFGSDRVGAEEVAEAVGGAIRCGYRLIDCAACYGNEDRIGRQLETVIGEGTAKREDLFITTKVWNDMHRKVGEACRKSLSNLKTDYADLYFIHWPFPNYHAPHCDVSARNPESRPFSAEEFLDTYGQVEQLVKEGLVKNIGISNMTIPKLEAVLPKVGIKPAACELELHPAFQQNRQLAYLKEHGIQPVGYMPLGSPRRPERDIMEEDIVDMKMPEITKIAEAHHCHPSLVCLKWGFQRGEVIIPFSTNPDHYFANLACVTEDFLTDEEMKAIGTLDRGNRLVKGQVFLWPGAKDWHDLWDEKGVLVK